MIDPYVLDFAGAGRVRLEEFALFSVAVAGKNAMTTSRILEEFLTDEWVPTSAGPFLRIRYYNNRADLQRKLRRLGMGCHYLKSKGFWHLAHSGINLRTCGPEELEECPGIGMKTSRFFLMHTRPGIELACLDTHILRWLRDQGYDAPKSTPTRRKYLELERIFLDECNKNGMAPNDMDLRIWSDYSTQTKERPSGVSTFDGV